MCATARSVPSFDCLPWYSPNNRSPDGTLRFGWVKAPTSAELARLTQTLALRIGRYLERHGNSYLAGGGLEAGAMEELLGSSIT